MADVTSHEAPVHQVSALPVTAPSKLIGRDTTLARVYTHLKENKVVLIYGAAGIGKTAVAATLANAYTELPGGSLWLQVDNPTLEELILRVGRAYNLETVTTSSTPLAYVGTIQATLLREKPLIVLDGKISSDVAREFLSRCAAGLATIICNDEDLEGDWTRFPLNALEPSQAAALFRTVASAEAESPEAINALVSSLNYMPYALVIAGGHVKATGKTAAEFTAAIPPAGANVNPTLLALTVAFKSLNGALQGLLLVIGTTFKGGASTELISMIGNAPPDTINQAIKQLTARGLVTESERYGEPYYQLHPITYAFAQSWLKGSNRIAGLQQKVRESVVNYAKKYSNGTSQAHDRLAAEMDNLLATATWAADQGERDVANSIAIALMQAGDFVNERGYVNELLTLRNLAASSTNAFPAYVTPSPILDEEETAETVDDDTSNLDLIEDEDEELESDAFDPIVAAVSSNVVIPPIDDDPDNEDLEELEDLEFEDEDEEEEDLPLFTPTSVAMPAVLPPIDIDDEDALDDELDDDFDDDFDDEDDLDLDIIEDSALIPPVEVDELTRLRTELVKAKQGNDRRKQSDLLAQIAKLMRERGMLSEAIQTYTEALNTEEAIDDQPSMLNTLSALAELTLKNENISAAAMYAQRGANIAEKRADDTAQIRLLTLLGDARQQLGESGDAVNAYQQALDVARIAEDPASEALLQFKLGYAHLDDSSPQEAIDVWEEALSLFRKQSRRDYEGRVLGGLGAAYGELERWTEAINFHMSALYIAREVKDKEEELLQLSNLGYASVQARQLGQAVLRYRQALHVAYTTDDRENIVGTTVDLARLLVESPRHLSIANLLIDSALIVEPTNRELKRIKERIEDEQEALLGDQVQQVSVVGSARDYAANAYLLLDQ